MPRQETGSLSKSFVQVSLTGGINTKQDPHQLSNGQLKTADNVIFGAVEGQVTKRFGCAAIQPQGATLQGGPFKALGVRDNLEPLILGANTLNRYNVEQRLSTSLPTPTQGRVDVTQVVGSTGQSQFPWPPSDPSVATDGTQYACVTWQEPNINGALCYYGVQDLASGTWIIPPTVLNNLFPSVAGSAYFSMSSPTVKYRNGNFYIAYLWTGKSGDMYYQNVVYGLLPLTNLAGGLIPGTNTGILLPNSGAAQAPLSPGPVGYDFHLTNDKWIISCGPSLVDNSTFSVNYGTFNASGNLIISKGLSLVSLYVGNFQRSAVRCDGPAATPYLVALSNSLTVYTATGTPTTYRASTVGSPQVLSIDCMWTPTGNAVWLGYNGSASSMQVVAMQVNPTAGTMVKVNAVPPLNTFYQHIISRMFTIGQNGKMYVWLGIAAPSSDSIYNSAFLCEFDFVSGTSMTVCRTLYLKNAHITNVDMMVPCDVVRIGNTSRYVTFIASSLEKTGDTYRAFGALNRVVFNFAPVRSTQLLSLPQGGVLGAGAYPFYYDGNTVVEAGFSATPTADRMSQTFATSEGNLPFVQSAGSGLAGGPSFVTLSGSVEYYYVICLVRRDAYGNVYRSAPSPVISVPCPNAFQSVTFQPYVYNGGGNVMIEYYRSTQNIPGTYYFIGQVANGSGYTDARNDGSTSPQNNTSITKNRTVYTNANELPNDPPPAVHHAAISETRVYLIPSDARNTIWFSKLFRPGRTVEFSANNVIATGSNSGLYTAIAVLDANIIVFKADQVLYFYGDGPDNAGNGGFSSFTRINTDVGCIDPASIVTIPDGILFRSRRGIELLNRQLQIIYVGAPVEPLVKAMGTIASAVVVPRFMQVRFVPMTAGQPVLVFDYGKGRWSTFSNMAAVTAQAIQGNYWWISQDGAKVYQETPDAYLDDGQPIVMTLETPEIPVGAGGIQGWGRAYRMALLGDFYSSHNLQVSFSYDHQAAYTDSVTFDTQKGLISGDTVYQFRCSRLPRSVMQTLRIKITESGTVGQSCAISNLALEVGTKTGLAKLAPQKTI